MPDIIDPWDPEVLKRLGLDDEEDTLPPVVLPPEGPFPYRGGSLPVQEDPGRLKRFWRAARNFFDRLRAGP